MTTRGLRVASIVLTLLVVGAACSSSSKNTSDSSTTTVPGATTVPDATTIPGVPTTIVGVTTGSTTAAAGSAYKLISALMIVNVPSGFTVQPDGIADTGATNLAKAAQDTATAGAAGVLKDAGFTLGYQRSWIASDGVSQNTVFLYEFKTPAGAAQYSAARIAQIEGTLPTGQITPFPVLIAGATGVHSESATNSFAAVVVAKGVYSIEAVATTGSKADQAPAASALAQAQFLRLP